MPRFQPLGRGLEVVVAVDVAAGCCSAIVLMSAMYLHACQYLNKKMIAANTSAGTGTKFFFRC
jgi:hypothetical protein